MTQNVVSLRVSTKKKEKTTGFNATSYHRSALFVELTGGTVSRKIFSEVREGKETFSRYLSVTQSITLP